ncbi:hypothetical protein AB1Y20_015287 [Prymnesium parvum]|uniref:Sialate O-acetylesterase domain-containing protein n=1 Tax=Prymnesium parvum TaxID=97485 RepID=A0AB34JY27_PRYPA
MRALPLNLLLLACAPPLAHGLTTEPVDDIPPFVRFGECAPKLVGENYDAPSHDLLQTPLPQTSEDCAQACCANLKCAGALFESLSAISYGGCSVNKPCCYMKTSVADAVPMRVPVKGKNALWRIAGRSQDDEHLGFLSATLGSHMVLQRAPQHATVWGHTAPGAKVATVMMSSESRHVLATTADADGIWRQILPPVRASSTPYNFTFASSNSSAERAEMHDVLFGDVYICGGQSNMEFAMPAVANASYERQRANDFPTIRFFSVGHRTASLTPLKDLQTVWEPWQVASNMSINRDFSPGHTLFSTFSAVCWLFGRELSEKLSPTGEVPIGLISNNWGGTKVEVWAPADSYASCNRTDLPPHGGAMYNAMILPYTVGPMAISGFIFYQGEADTANASTAEQYACLFPEMIKAWRSAFRAPTAYFGFIQLSTWCALPPEGLPQLREAQMAALRLRNVGYATNADHGMGCDIHPSAKQFCAARLARSALAIGYGLDVAWRSPTYAAASQTSLDQVEEARGARTSTASLMVRLQDVSAAGLHLVHPFNYESPGYGQGSAPVIVDCMGSFPINATANSSMLQQCAWAGLKVRGVGWLNASVSVLPNGNSLLLTAQLPKDLDGPLIEASAYAWGPIPMMSAYDVATGLPVLPWNMSVHARGP